jgi:hypothetical protein
MLELESRFEVQRKRLLVVGWFEGSGKGRLVVTGPNDEQEVVQVASLDVSLYDEVQEALSEPPPEPRPGAIVTARLTMVTEGSRVVRAMELKGGGTQFDALCLKLLAMAELMMQTEALLKVIRALKARCG